MNFRKSQKNKGISPFISLILIVIISFVGITLVLSIGIPVVEKSKDFSLITEAKEILTSINSAIKEVSYEGEGSSRKVSLRVSGGEYRTSALNNEIVYELKSEYELFPPGIFKKEGDIYIKAYSNFTVNLILNYDKIDIMNDLRWARGSYDLIVRNNGKSGEKTNVTINLA